MKNSLFFSLTAAVNHLHTLLFRANSRAAGYPSHEFSGELTVVSYGQ